MALTPEDVVNKRFNPTKFREGYDQDEVDDFLDEVVVELRRLNQENEELRQRLVAGESRINELQRGGSPVPIAATASEPVAAAPEPVPVPTPAAPVASDHVSDTSSTNNLLQLARRLHEEHVREGVEKRDALIAEGHATAARAVSEAQETQRVQLGRLEAQKAQLESSISELRGFETEYRTKLKSYIEGQLRDLETSPTVVGDGPSPVSGSIGLGQGDSSSGDFASASADPGGARGGDRPGFVGRS